MPSRQTPTEMVLLAVFLGGLLAGWLAHTYAIHVKLADPVPTQNATPVVPTSPPPPGATPPNENKAFRFTQPVEGNDGPTLIQDEAALGLRTQVQAAIEQATQANLLREASVYYVDLDRGRWFELNGAAAYQPASLLKVPVMMDYLRRSQNTPGLLDSLIVNDVPADIDTMEDRQASNALQPGQAYRVSDLLERMITSSRNDAKILLSLQIGLAGMETLHANLGLPPIEATHGNVFMTVHGYAKLFDSLYRSKYLHKDQSEMALALLSRAEFRDGLVAGVAPGVQVAHKFGVWTLAPDQPGGPSEQLHDCGIIYDPHGPYMLCVMTRGNTRRELALAIQSISRTVAKFEWRATR